MLDRNLSHINTIVEYCEYIIESLKNITKDEFNNNYVLMHAVAFELTQIGEAVRLIDDEFKEKYKEVEWKKINGMRNIIVHNYGHIDTEILYSTIKKDIPKLIRDLKVILKEAN